VFIIHFFTRNFRYNFISSLIIRFSRLSAFIELHSLLYMYTIFIVAHKLKFRSNSTRYVSKSWGRLYFFFCIIVLSVHNYSLFIIHDSFDLSLLQMCLEGNFVDFFSILSLEFSILCSFISHEYVIVHNAYTLHLKFGLWFRVYMWMYGTFKFPCFTFH